MLYLRGNASRGQDVNEYVEGLHAAGAMHVDGAVIENSGEYLPLEAPQDFCDRLRLFCAQLRSGR